MKRTSCIAAAAACAILFGAASPAAAQLYPRVASGAAASQMRTQDDALERRRLEQLERQESMRRDHLSPEEVKSAAQAALSAAGNACSVIDAVQVSRAETGDAFEVTCQNGPGYAVIASNPPQVFDCVILAGQASVLRAKDPAADVGTLCNLPANQNVEAIMRQYADAAKVPCTVEQVGFVGRSPQGAAIFEASCAQADGYWFSQTAPGDWRTVECLEVIKDGGACRLTTPQAQAAALQARLVETPAAACAVQQAAFLGQNTNGRFYEAKCGSGDGVVVRIKDGVADQTYSCVDARHIGGGCTMTPVASSEQ